MFKDVLGCVLRYVSGCVRIRACEKVCEGMYERVRAGVFGCVKGYKRW